MYINEIHARLTSQSKRGSVSPAALVRQWAYRGASQHPCVAAHPVEQPAVLRVQRAMRQSRACHWQTPTIKNVNLIFWIWIDCHHQIDCQCLCLITGIPCAALVAIANKVLVHVGDGAFGSARSNVKMDNSLVFEHSQTPSRRVSGVSPNLG